MTGTTWTTRPLARRNGSYEGTLLGCVLRVTLSSTGNAGAAAWITRIEHGDRSWRREGHQGGIDSAYRAATSLLAEIRAGLR